MTAAQRNAGHSWQCSVWYRIVSAISWIYYLNIWSALGIQHISSVVPNSRGFCRFFLSNKHSKGKKRKEKAQPHNDFLGYCMELRWGDLIKTTGTNHFKGGDEAWSIPGDASSAPQFHYVALDQHNKLWFHKIILLISFSRSQTTIS